MIASAPARLGVIGAALAAIADQLDNLADAIGGLR